MLAHDKHNYQDTLTISFKAVNFVFHWKGCFQSKIFHFNCYQSWSEKADCFAKYIF